ncbi:hypothetical protein SNE40_018356 [Patella caerulea]|uniref:Uncharacterized protein n=1 Tax=Patella caerulea TaxID=87958 RepID=A0AAN8J9F6_PATCE
MIISKESTRHVHHYIWDDPLINFDARDDEVTLSNSGVKLNRRRERECHTLTIEQWGFGAAEILQELIRNGEISTSGIKDYLDYTKTIFRLFSGHVTASVLLNEQQKGKFRWNTSRSNIFDFQLISKPTFLKSDVALETVSRTFQQT